MNFGRRLARLVARVGSVEVIKRLQHRVLGFQKSPPHGNGCFAEIVLEGVVDDRAMHRLAQLQLHRFLAFDFDGFGAAGEVHPLVLVPDLVGVRWVEFLSHQVHIVVLEHGQAPAEIPVMAKESHRIERLEVAVQLEPGRLQVRFVPDRRC